jgi:hypothetical protein
MWWSVAIGQQGIQTLPMVSACGKIQATHVVIEEISPEISLI